MTNEELELRNKSGSVSTTDPWAVLLYLLLKECVAPDKLESLLKVIAELIPKETGGTVNFNNGWLGSYAINIRDRLNELKDVNTPSKNVNDAVVLKNNPGFPNLTKELDGILTKEELELLEKDIVEYQKDTEKK